MAFIRPNARTLSAISDLGGACTIAQDEASRVVFGMSKEAVTLGAADEALPLGGIAAAVLSFDARS